jgi:hypothetical protein
MADFCGFSDPNAPGYVLDSVNARRRLQNLVCLPSYNQKHAMQNAKRHMVQPIGALAVIDFTVFTRAQRPIRAPYHSRRGLKSVRQYHNLPPMTALTKYGT